ncbi:uncharacterized protein B0H64DRAFT_388906 [Chaetomium fimeti]|uniref:Uncharacterized protein n=1 Tax=Chaetomium fimeti TaxID=1854472 RepID=A0AAE0HMZ7_9PEZI|nr:hypothetical protein B0H64DRAFT_388906 [Chaetomium fimeti]
MRHSRTTDATMSRALDSAPRATRRPSGMSPTVTLTQGDVIQWLIAVTENHGPKQLTAPKIATRILALTSMFVFAIGWVFAHVGLDIYSSPSRDDFVSGLEEECARVSDEDKKIATKEAADALYRLDSAVRESMRPNDAMVHLMPLDVWSGEGIDLGGGIRITAGSGVRTVFPAQMVHMDPCKYKVPERPDAFRFSREFDEAENAGSPSPAGKRELMTNVTAKFLPLG